MDNPIADALKRVAEIEKMSGLSVDYSYDEIDAAIDQLATIAKPLLELAQAGVKLHDASFSGLHTQGSLSSIDRLANCQAEYKSAYDKALAAILEAEEGDPSHDWVGDVTASGV